MNRSVKQTLSKMYVPHLALAAMALGVSIAYANSSADPQAYCKSHGGYIANNTCYIGSPATCGPSNPMTMCFDPIPQAGVPIRTCSCGN